MPPPPLRLAPLSDTDIDRECVVNDYDRAFALLGERVAELTRFFSLHRVEFAAQAGIDHRKARCYVADLSMWVASLDSIILGQHTASDYRGTVPAGRRQ